MKLEKISLRPMQESDSSYLVELFMDVRQMECNLLPLSSDQKYSLFESQKNTQIQYYETTFPNTKFNIVLYEEKPIGRFFISSKNNSIRVLDIAIHSEFRKQGIGSFLLKQLIEKSAQPEGEIRLSVEKTNPAYDLYQKLGFKTIWEEDMSYEMTLTSQHIKKG